MGKFVSWVQKTVTSLVDPEKDSRQERLIAVIRRELAAKKRDFVLREAVSGISCSALELQTAKESVFRDALGRAWQDDVLTGGEINSLKWIAEALQLPLSKASEMNLFLAQERFARMLAAAMEDGHLDDGELKRLSHIAKAAGAGLPAFARRFFRSQGEAFLRGIFHAAIADGYISPEEWNNFVVAATHLGISHEEMLTVVQPQATMFVERVLADAKADGVMDDGEAAILDWLLTSLRLSEDVASYVRSEMEVLKRLTAIGRGDLPVVALPPGLALKSGEILHYHGPSIWRNTRHLKSGTRVDDHRGYLSLTDHRILFTSDTKSQSFAFRKVVNYRISYDRLDVQLQGKPATTFLFNGDRFAAAIFDSAIALANRQLVPQQEGASSRHIPHDVRNRVFQRDGGHCVECGAVDYLEYDHIIPHSKGGSNSDANIQLLCRRCNLKKSDKI